MDRFRERLLEKLEETQEFPAKSSTSKSSNSKTTSSSKSSKPSSSSSSKRRHNSNSTSSKRHEESRSSHRRHSKSPTVDEYSASPISGKRSREDLPDLKEEGEASDDEVGASSHGQSKRAKHRDDEVIHCWQHNICSLLELSLP